MAKPEVPLDVIQDTLRRRWGELTELRPLPEGLSSQVFGFRRGADELVIRINRSVEGFRKDAYVSRTFASLALPIPEILDIDRIDEDHAYCISRRAPGVRLQDLAEKDMDGVASDVCRVLDAIASVDLKGTDAFGPFGALGRGRYASWREFLLSIRDAHHYDWARCRASVDDRVVRRATEGIERLVEVCPEERRLVHGDFGSYNVLSDGTGVTAVIDWDLALFGDPLYDWAGLLFWNEEKMKPVIDRLHVLKGLSWQRERVRCYQLRIGLEETYRSAMGENPVSLEWLTSRCLQILDQYR